MILKRQSTDGNLRVVAEDGTQLGIMPASTAHDLADRQRLDLVVVNQSASPMVVKIADAGKLAYAAKKAAKEQAAKARSNAVVVKEVRLTPVIGANDLAVKTRQINEWLADRCRVKITVVFRGRQISHAELGHEVIRRLLDSLTVEFSTVQEMTKNGKTLSLVISPATAK